MFKIGRNDRCWCGSGKKYKACHEFSDEQKLQPLVEQGYPMPTRDLILSPEQIQELFTHVAGEAKSFTKDAPDELKNKIN